MLERLEQAGPQFSATRNAHLDSNTLQLQEYSTGKPVEAWNTTDTLKTTDINSIAFLTMWLC